MRDVVRWLSRLLGVAVLGVPLSRAATLPGDINCDGTRDPQDVRALVSEIVGDGNALTNANPPCMNADVNADGTVNSAHLVALMLLFEPAPPPPATPPPSTVH